jgi:predicted transcriptional regulator
MKTTTVRVPSETRDAMREMARREGVPMVIVLQKAVDAYRRRRFWDEVDRAYASLRADRKAWKKEEDERRVWNDANLDGLGDE